MRLGLTEGCLVLPVFGDGEWLFSLWQADPSGSQGDRDPRIKASRCLGSSSDSHGSLIPYIPLDKESLDSGTRRRDVAD